MIVRYSVVYDTLVLYYYNKDGDVVLEDLDFEASYITRYASLSEVRTVIAGTPIWRDNIISDDGEL